jgi:hypothetical protein
MSQKLNSAFLRKNPELQSFLLDEYKFEYGETHSHYKDHRTSKPKRLTELLHPIFVNRNLGKTLKIGHVTDTHVDVRNDVYEINLLRKRDLLEKAGIFPAKSPIQFNNWNRAFEDVYASSKQSSDIILMTGDLIDYGRGHFGSGRLDRDEYYHVGRNWFLFYHLLASGTQYEKPVYTTLGNHDWRLNPYPPFAPSTPVPEEFIYNLPNPQSSKPFTPAEMKTILQIAHGPGHDLAFTYANVGEDLLSILRTAWQAKTLIPNSLFGTRAKLDYKQLPVFTAVESVAWYLLVINPFLDYQYTLPTGHQLLMLDFAENEELRNTVENHHYGPRALDCLTSIQQWHVEQFTNSPGNAKTIGMHIPPIGPRPDWSVRDLQTGVKTYKFPDTPRYKDRQWKWRLLRNMPLPLMATIPTIPEGFSPWLAANYGSFVHEDKKRGDTRKWFIEKLSASHGVRLVLSGHIHRAGLLTAQWKNFEIRSEGQTEKPISVKTMVVQSVLPNEVQGVRAPLVRSQNNPGGPLPGPLYVNTTSAGPIGSEYIDGTVKRRDLPGYSIIHLSSDGTIEKAWQGYPALSRLATPVLFTPLPSRTAGS